MKQQAIQYLAFDVHQATIVGVARDEKGTIVLRATVATEARAILQLVKSAGPRVQVAFEEGTQAQWLALFRARAIPTKGTAVYRSFQRKQWLAKLEGGSRVRATALFSHLDVLLALRPPASAAMLAEARRQSGWKVLRSIPYLGPIRVLRFCPSSALRFDCSAHPRVLAIVATRSVGADCKGEKRKAISKGENRP